MAATTRTTQPRERSALHEWRLDVSGACAGPDRLEVAATLVTPEAQVPRALLACLPGGFLGRRYYDLEVDGDRGYSFADAMALRGFATLAFDHLGVDESSRPVDGWALDPDTLARANQLALEAAMVRSERELGFAPVPVLGVGHSMGSCLAVVQQANHSSYKALVLFSFATSGLPDFLQGREAGVAHDPAAIRERIVELARERFGQAYPGDAPDADHAAFSVGSAPPAAARALERAATGVLPIPGLLSMIPGGFAPWAEQVRIPTLVARGDHDLPGSAEGAIASLPAASRVDTFTQPDCWHCHFVSNTREALFQRVADWIDDTLDPTD